ncbi:MAG: calcium-binding protein [Actinomycetota bacterium]
MSLRAVSAAVAGVLAIAASGPPPTAGAGPPNDREPRVRAASRHDTSPPLRVLARRAPAPTAPRYERPPLRREPPAGAAAAPSGEPSSSQARSGSPSIPDPTLTFEGVSNEDNELLGEGLPIPPDTVGDVGPNHYVQMTNVVTEIFDKQGATVFGPVTNNTFWAGLGGLCETTNQGDPIVRYDPLADRWVVSQFAFNVNLSGNPIAPFHQCVAVSATADPTGQYHRYDFFWSNTEFNDYPKLGVWPDAYYLSVNEFDLNGDYNSASVAALDRDAMLNGDPASLIEFDLSGISPNSFTLLPSDVDGPAPPAGSPNYLVELRDPVFFPPPVGLNVWRFHVDFATPANSTLTGPTARSTTSYDILFGCGGQGFGPCIPQPNTGRRLDQLADRLMHRNAYRNLGTHESLVLSHTVDVMNNGAGGPSRAGVRWYELRNPAGNPPTLFQEGTHAPGGLSRWMPSVAMNGDGSIGIGYSSSGGSAFPSIRYAGRAATDGVGQLAQGEATLFAGSGSQTDNSGRWGDYSAMSVDPVDDATFWYTNEYYPVTSPRGWQTRIGAFEIPVAPPPNCFGQPATIVGTSVAETITGTAGPDVIVAKGGADTIKGLGGKDLICAGGGKDDVNGGAGADRIKGQGGNDTIAGGGGKDVLLGNVGKDVLKGGGGDDTLRGQGGQDLLKGGAGDDLLNGGPGIDTCKGGPGKDTLISCEK